MTNDNDNKQIPQAGQAVQTAEANTLTEDTPGSRPEGMSEGRPGERAASVPSPSPGEPENRPAEEPLGRPDGVPDVSGFAIAYPGVDVDLLLRDEAFADYAEGKFEKKRLTEIYRGFLKQERLFRDKANRQAARTIANARATPGPLATAGSEKTYFSPEDVKKMSRDEIGKNWDRIRESRKKWPN